MPATIHATAFPELFINDIPLLDVRAPIEYLRGAFPLSTNLPLLTDEERAAVGRSYQSAGKEAAYALGSDLVSGATKQQRIKAWADYLGENPDALLYCFRGGLRSQVTQQWLSETSINVPRIEGGYKALRNFLMATLESASANSKFLIVAGKAGSAKTHLINELQHSIDLEGIANHRGSAFGRRVSAQPSQINFENSLAIALLRLPYQRIERIFLEDESRAIGSLSIPLSLHQKMRESDIAVIEESLEFRVDTILHDYIVSNYLEFSAANSAQADREFADFLLSSLERIQKRLGTQKYHRMRTTMQSALASQLSTGNFHPHREWIQSLLTEYYDPMYDYQLNKKLQRVVFRGNPQEFLSWSSQLNRQHSSSTDEQ